MIYQIWYTQRVLKFGINWYFSLIFLMEFFEMSTLTSRIFLNILKEILYMSSKFFILYQQNLKAWIKFRNLIKISLFSC